MTDDSRRANIMAELRRGGEALAAARVLQQAGLHADAISRAYYAAFHHARALLLQQGVEPLSHGGVERLLHRDLVRTGKLDADVARLLSRLMKYRHDADYTADFAFTATGAAEELQAAESFIAASLACLAAAGWIAA